ncbi:MAG: beta-N-acetylglucosaminidase domain-containing protein [Victivallaceae bacterium]|nr:beta-N-acetylglucosaminidase domain-containing protein [Victivallaceae bacterium]
MKKQLLALCAASLALAASAAENLLGVSFPSRPSRSFSMISMPVSGVVSVTASDPAVAEMVAKIASFGIEAERGGSDLILKLKKDPSLPIHGYRIDFAAEPVTIHASDNRGFYYAAASLRQMLQRGKDGRLYLSHAPEVTDFPKWTEPCVSDIMNNGTFNNLLTLARYKIAGICLRTEGNWQDEKWMKDMAPVLADIKRSAELDLCDVVIQMHLFPKAQRRMNLADESDIKLITDRVRTFAENGVKTVMIAVDDLTPRDGKTFTYFTEQEKAKFGPNAGRGHGYVMKRLYDSLHNDFPNLRLMMVVAPYASENHNSQYPEVQEYFRQWGKAAPEQVFLVWTGPYVFSPVITREEQDNIKQYLSGQRMIVFDNSNGVAAPMPVWNGIRFPGMERESDGVVIIWGSFFLRPLERIYYLTAIDYFWDPENYDADRSYTLAAHELFGAAAAQPLLRLQKAFQAVEAAMSTTDRRDFAPLLAEFELALTAAKKVTDAEGKPLPLAQLDAPLAAAREFLNGGTRKLEISKEKPAAIKLIDRKNPKDPEPTEVTIGNDGENLLLHFYIPNPEPPAKTVALPHDAPVYLADDCVEMFIQPCRRKAVWLNSEPPSDGYAHLVFDFAGNRFDEYGVSSGFNYDPRWEVRTAPAKNGWTADVTIPFAAFERFKPFFEQPGPGAEWKINLHRVNNKTGQVQSWDGRGDTFHAPQFFGELLFQ